MSIGAYRTVTRRLSGAWCTGRPDISDAPPRLAARAAEGASREAFCAKYRRQTSDNIPYPITIVSRSARNRFVA